MTRCAFFFALMAAAADAQGAGNCGPREIVVDRLAQRYGETRQFMGVGLNAIAELFTSSEAGTWTIIVTTPDRIACIRAQGKSFEMLSESLPEKGNDL